MSKIFIATDENFKREYVRKGAKGYKRVVIADDVTTSTPVEIKSDGDTLRVVSCADDGQEPSYMILCNEFGMMGYTQAKNNEFKSEVSVLSLDGDYMLLTLYSGALLLNMADTVIMPNTKVEIPPRGSAQEILWCDYKFFERYMKYVDDMESRFYYDFERHYIIGGGRTPTNGVDTYLDSTYFKELKEQNIDLSLGLYASYVQQSQLKAEAKQSQAEMKNIVSLMANSNTNTEFEEDEDEWEDEDDDDWGEEV